MRCKTNSNCFYFSPCSMIRIYAIRKKEKNKTKITSHMRNRPPEKPAMIMMFLHVRRQASPLLFYLAELLILSAHLLQISFKLEWLLEKRSIWGEIVVRLQSMGSRRVRHDWATSLSLFTFMHWRRKWQPTPVFLPGESQGWGSLVGCHLWGCTESDTTEVT